MIIRCIKIWYGKSKFIWLDFIKEEGVYVDLFD